MKKIFISIGIIFVITALVSRGTVAFFSDEEGSRGNIFTAGSLDLKVDSTAHYNGLICRDNVWTDPDEPDPREPDNQCDEDDNDSDDECDDSDENEDSDGGEEQRTPGKCPTWVDLECQDFGFDFGVAKWDWRAGHYQPDGDPNGTIVTGTDELANWEAHPAVDGVIFKTRQSTTVLPGGTNGSASTTHHGIRHLTFCENENPPVCGNGIVEEGEQCDGTAGVPDGYICSAQCTFVEDRECTGTWELTDLEDGVHTFFSLSNLKPGDYGENTISIHVLDNDAWARIALTNLVDNDNGCVEPEVGADVDCQATGDAGGVGELHSKMLFSAWLDQGRIPGFQNTNRQPGNDGYDELEGDNLYQEAYEPLFRDNALLPLTGETWNLWEILSDAFVTYCNSPEYAVDGDDAQSACHGIAQDGRVLGETTYYIGFAWELPLNAGNSVESDILSGDLRLEIEQHRHIVTPFSS